MRKWLHGARAGLLLVVILQPMPMLSPKNDLMAQTPGQDSKVEVKVVKYDDLKDMVKERKGHLVVVDFWSTT
jgi:hypothetical protein